MLTNFTTLLRRIPLIGAVAAKLHCKWHSIQALEFSGSAKYWDDRYLHGGNSGRGSYGGLAEYKAEIINEFVERHSIDSVVEFGCGDGNQLALAKYPAYLGFDVSPTAIDICRRRFEGDVTKTFALIDDYHGESADLAISLDVIYHLVEDSVFNTYMNRLFRAGRRFVIVYSSNSDFVGGGVAEHVRHRCFTAWIEKNQPEWRMMRHLPNPNQFDPVSDTGSPADFYLFEPSE